VFEKLYEKTDEKVSKSGCMLGMDKGCKLDCNKNEATVSSCLAADAEVSL